MNTPGDQPGPVQPIVIAGGGTAGWMVAAALSRFLTGTGIQISLVESAAIGTVGVGEATIPPLADFNHMLGIEEDEFLRETGGSFKLGIDFHSWGQPGERYFHPFSAFGYDINHIPFHQFWLRQHRAGTAAPLDEYTLGWHAARGEKFIRPNTQDPLSPLSQLRHAYHIDAGRYAALLRRYAEARGVQRIEGRIVEVGRDGESGFLTHLKLDDDRRVAGQLFVDCTGFRSLLLGETLGVPFEDWSHWLPCDRAVALPSAANAQFGPYTRATAGDAGWGWRIPLQHRTGNGQVYCSNFLSDDQALERLQAALDGEALAEPNFLRFRAGRRRRFFSHNCVAVGLSAGFLEPLESTSIHLIQEGVGKLIALFPDQNFAASERDSYNQLLGNLYDYIRDFIVLHYHATQRTDTDFWNQVRTMPIPDSLLENLNLFRARGRFFSHRADLFSMTSWVAVLLGQNVLPEACDPLALAAPAEDVQQALDDMRRVYQEAAQRMPPHGAFIERFCAADDYARAAS